MVAELFVISSDSGYRDVKFTSVDMFCRNIGVHRYRYEGGTRKVIEKI